MNLRDAGFLLIMSGLGLMPISVFIWNNDIMSGMGGIILVIGGILESYGRYKEAQRKRGAK